MRYNENVYGGAYNLAAYSVMLDGEKPAPLHLDTAACLRGISYPPANANSGNRFVIEQQGTYLVTYTLNGVPSSYGTYTVSVTGEGKNKNEENEPKINRTNQRRKQTLPGSAVSVSVQSGGGTVCFSNTFLAALSQNDAIGMELYLPYRAYFTVAESAARLYLIRVGP